MVSALDCRSRGLGTRQDLAKSMCCVLWQNTLLSQCLSPSPPTHPGVYMSICELSGKPDEIVEEGETLGWTGIPSRGKQLYSQSLHLKEVRKPGHLACVQIFHLILLMPFNFRFFTLSLFLFACRNGGHIYGSMRDLHHGLNTCVWITVFLNGTSGHSLLHLNSHELWNWMLLPTGRVSS